MGNSVGSKISKKRDGGDASSARGIAVITTVPNNINSNTRRYPISFPSGNLQDGLQMAQLHAESAQQRILPDPQPQQRFGPNQTNSDDGASSYIYLPNCNEEEETYAEIPAKGLRDKLPSCDPKIDDSLDKGRPSIEYMVEVFRVPITRHVQPQRLLPHLHCVGKAEESRITAVSKTDPVTAMTYLIEYIESCNEPGKWQQFAQALEAEEYHIFHKLILSEIEDIGDMQRELIRACRSSITERIYFPEIIDKLLERSVINSTDKEEIENIPSSKDAGSLLLDRIHTKSPNWFMLFIQVCKECHLDDVVEMLDLDWPKDNSCGKTRSPSQKVRYPLHTVYCRNCVNCDNTIPKYKMQNHYVTEEDVKKETGLMDVRRPRSSEGCALSKSDPMQQKGSVFTEGFRLGNRQEMVNIEAELIKNENQRLSLEIERAKELKAELTTNIKLKEELKKYQDDIAKLRRTSDSLEGNAANEVEQNSGTSYVCGPNHVSANQENIISDEQPNVRQTMIENVYEKPDEISNEDRNDVPITKTNGVCENSEQIYTGEEKSDQSLGIVGVYETPDSHIVDTEDEEECCTNNNRKRSDGEVTKELTTSNGVYPLISSNGTLDTIRGEQLNVFEALLNKYLKEIHTLKTFQTLVNKDCEGTEGLETQNPEQPKRFVNMLDTCLTEVHQLKSSNCGNYSDGYRNVHMM